MQVRPDWGKICTPTDFESIFDGSAEGSPPLKFKGPGLYLLITDTILVVPRPPLKPPTKNNVWYAKQKRKTPYAVYVWNVPFDQTIFAAISTAPVRYNSL